MKLALTKAIDKDRALYPVANPCFILVVILAELLFEHLFLDENKFTVDPPGQKNGTTNHGDAVPTRLRPC